MQHLNYVFFLMKMHFSVLIKMIMISYQRSKIVNEYEVCYGYFHL